MRRWWNTEKRVENTTRSGVFFLRTSSWLKWARLRFWELMTCISNSWTELWVMKTSLLLVYAKWCRVALICEHMVCSGNRRFAGRALHRYRRVQGFESHTRLNVFRLSFRNAKVASINDLLWWNFSPPQFSYIHNFSTFCVAVYLYLYSFLLVVKLSVFVIFLFDTHGKVRKFSECYLILWILFSRSVEFILV